MFRSTVSTSRTVLGQKRVGTGVPQSSWITWGHLGIGMQVLMGHVHRPDPRRSASGEQWPLHSVLSSAGRTHMHAHLTVGGRVCKRAPSGTPAPHEPRRVGSPVSGGTATVGPNAAASPQTLRHRKQLSAGARRGWSALRQFPTLLRDSPLGGKTVPVADNTTALGQVAGQRSQDFCD